MKIISIDSYPKLSELCLDYSSSQVCSLSALTLLESYSPPLPGYVPFYHGKIVVSDIYKLKIELSCFGSFYDKKPVKVEHYINRFLFLKKNHPLLNFSLLADLEISTDSDSLTFRAKHPITPLEELLRSVLFTPKHFNVSAESAGEYIINFTANSFFARDRKEKNDVHFVIIKDPVDNYQLAKAGFLYQTANTATLQTKKTPVGYNSFKHPSSLHAYLLFKNRLAQPDNLAIRKSLYSILDKELRVILNLVDWEKSLRGFIYQEDDSELSKTVEYFRYSPLILSYNDFYPNASIIHYSGMILEKYDIKYKIVADNYYKPEVKSDLSLLILQGVIPGEWGQYYCLLFFPVIVAYKELVKGYLHVLKSDISFTDIKNWVTNNLLVTCPFIYLGELFSHYYRKIL